MAAGAGTALSVPIMASLTANIEGQVIYPALTVPYSWGRPGRPPRRRRPTPVQAQKAFLVNELQNSEITRIYATCTLAFGLVLPILAPAQSFQG